ncbi:hypothetical protein MUY35_01210 [Aliiroseovarius sp. S1339]|uniref:hypothetical protein n=1 Tax=Aliiroseovarius sp. S1339 TaxID=2936990 RepID=UPI0020C183BC|nr:hypothetical protein [Aliiroseovarius sp. S1339]MCK8462465.1 hypothetical protein [Aliiroseovarius sp. S1339]
MSSARRQKVPEILLLQDAHAIVAANLPISGPQDAIPNIAVGANLISSIPLRSDQNRSVRIALVTSIADLYPNGWIEGVRPDLLENHPVDPDCARRIANLHLRRAWHFLNLLRWLIVTHLLTAMLLTDEHLATRLKTLSSMLSDAEQRDVAPIRDAVAM